MTELIVLGAMLSGAALFAAVRHGLDSRGKNAPLGLGTNESDDVTE